MIDYGDRFLHIRTGTSHGRESDGLMALICECWQEVHQAIGSVIRLLGLDLAIPDHSTLSRRAETLGSRLATLYDEVGGFRDSDLFTALAPDPARFVTGFKPRLFIFLEPCSRAAERTEPVRDRRGRKPRIAEMVNDVGVRQCVGGDGIAVAAAARLRDLRTRGSVILGTTESCAG
jgi:hypothetical protein